MATKRNERQNLQRNRIILLIAFGVSIVGLFWILGNENLPFCAFPKNWESNYVSQGLDVSAPPKFNRYLINDSIVLYIKNETEFEIFYPADSKITVVELDKCNTQLGELKDMVIRSTSNDWTIGPKGDPLSAFIDNVFPAVGVGKQEVFVGVCLVGYVIRDGEITNEQVGGCEKVTLYRERNQIP
jgi:hypothetical protein